ncbi:MAG: DNA repair protein RadA [Deltaproteobacteria bacterium]|nr:MAG: DNA repair protein RadA [Deltaproteobacteria bacterium]
MEVRPAPHGTGALEHPVPEREDRRLHLNRFVTGMGQLDNPLGGGLVAGSVVLIGGDPGVGKSTLGIAASGAFARAGRTVLYVTGEESLQQVRMRAERTGVDPEGILLMAETEWEAIARATRATGAHVLVVDSAQTVHVQGVDGIPGSVPQVREVAHRARLLATDTHAAVVLLGHSSRSSELAGPVVLEHFVDTVLDFTANAQTSLRTLRTVKNRFGEAGEFGLFEMSHGGLVEIPDPSARLLVARKGYATGTSVAATVEGSRPLLVEVQALVGRPTLGETPVRHFVGVDETRIRMLAAILDNNGNLGLHDRSLYVNTSGGYTLVERGADVAVAAAFASSLLKMPVREDTAMFGEIGLVGQVRPVRHPERRYEECVAQGFTRVIAPQDQAGAPAPDGLEVIGVSSVRDVLAELFD